MPIEGPCIGSECHESHVTVRRDALVFRPQSGVEYLENSYISPDWWEAIPEPYRRGLISHDAARGVYQRPPAISRALGRPIAYVTASVIAKGAQAAAAI